MEPVIASWTACFSQDLLNLRCASWFPVSYKRFLNLCGKRVMDGLNKASVLKKRSDNSKGKQSKARFYVWEGRTQESDLFQLRAGVSEAM